MRDKIAPAAEVVALNQSGDSFCTSGFGGIGTPGAASCQGRFSPARAVHFFKGKAEAQALHERT